MRKGILLLLLLFITSMHHTCQGDVFDEFCELYALYGNGKYMIQEEITQKEHVLQAAYFAELAGAPEEIIVALLFHDVGQLSIREHVGDANYLHARHAEFGYQWLIANGFPQVVCDLVRYHDLAKLVLCADEDGYFEQLSEASKISYSYQSEKYARPEYALSLQEFHQNPRKADFLSARKCDDIAKIVAFSPRSFNDYQSMIERVIRGESRATWNPRWRESIDHLFNEMVRDRAQFEKSMRERV